MISFQAFKILIMVVYVWFVIGAGIIGFFAAKELWFLVAEKKEGKEIPESGKDVNYEM